MLRTTVTIIFLAGSFAFGHEADFASLLNAGVGEYLNRHYQEADKLLHKALDAAQKMNDDYAVALAYSTLGDVYQVEERFTEAEQAYSKGLSIVAGHRERSHAAAIMWRNLATVFTAETRYKEAEDYFQRSLAIVEQTATPLDERLLMQALLGLSQIYIQQNEEMRAELLLRRAVEIARRNVRQIDIPVSIEVLETYSKVLKVLSKPLEADRLQAEAQRIRASNAFTVEAKPGK